MSRLGDLLVAHGPFDDAAVPLPVRSYAMQVEELNDLRDELIELRAKVPAEVVRRVMARSKEVAAQEALRSTESVEPAGAVGRDARTGTDGPSGSG